MARSKRKKSSSTRQVVVQKNSGSWLKKLLVLFVGSGVLAVLLGVAYRYLAGNISLEFVQPIGRAYEFQLKNETPSDRVVRSFRIDPPSMQNVVYRVTEDVYADVDTKGHVTLPGGNISYVPAAEFRELDGQRVLANSSLKFRVPPLSSRSWMEPEATIVDVHYEVESSSSVLSAVEKLLDAVGFRSRTQTIRYLVIGNYWSISQSSSISEAIRVFCRDNEAMVKSSICR